MTDLVKIKEDINKQLADPQILQDLVNTTFKGLQPQMVKRAIYEGVQRGFTFKDFLEKNVYAIPYGNEYSLVTSIDYARKIGMRSGVVGKSAPEFVEKDGKIISCTVTVNRKVQDYVGDYTATVFFNEYYAGHKYPDGKIKQTKYGPMKPNLWDTKPHTMIAKVAEMQALRMACPEEMSQVYVSEEYEQGDVIEGDPVDENWSEDISALGTVEELKKYYAKNKGKGAEFDKMVKQRYEALRSSDEKVKEAPDTKDKKEAPAPTDGLTDEDKKEILKEESQL